MRKLIALCLIVIVCALLPLAAFAQDGAAPARDPLALAQRLLGYEPTFAFPELAPIYEVGDTLRFYVPRRGADAPEQISATLVGRSALSYVWVEDGVETGEDAETLAQLALQYAAIFQQIRLRSTFGEPTVPLEAGETPLEEDVLPIPDVDSAPQVFVLYTRELRDDRIAFFNPLDSATAVLLPAETSNEHELIYVDTSLFPDVPLSDGIYLNAVMRTFFSLVAEHNYPSQADWLQAALTDLSMQRLQQANLPTADLLAYFDQPNTSLLQVGNFATRQRHSGGQYLFLSYFFQRAGSDSLLALFRAGGSGVTALDSVLAEGGLTDPVTNDALTARRLFADFVITNALNRPFGDGRYMHTAVPVREGAGANVTVLDSFGDTTIGDRPVEQFASYYLALGNDGEADSAVVLRFDGRAETPLLRMPAERDPEDLFYWSGRAQDANARMTRSLDLRAASAATLTFDAWYAQPYDLNYAYVSVSTDDGVTWTLLPTTHAAATNPYGAAYGPGLTGFSNPDGATPYPIMGVVVGDIVENGITVERVAEEGPAARAGVEAGDIITGYDGQAWDRVPNMVTALQDFAPGETITLMIMRGEEALDIPVVLDAHPTRRVMPDAQWLRHEADLSAYAGQEVLLRFETVTLPAYETEGFAVDNIEVLEVNYGDGGEQAENWTLEGFVSTSNQTTQQFIVQTAVLGPQNDSPISVQQLIAPGSDETTGEWRYALAPGQVMLIAVSAANDDTAQAALFDLTIDVDAE